MGTLRRYHEDNRPYFVTTVVKERRPIFADHRAASLLQEVFDTCRRRYQFLLLSHVIMPDHAHAIIAPGIR